ncbi:MAG: putative rane protein involved in D-alanine export [Bacteroidetes bacterium]|nr:putative rane protein involved in D-alanine export [Bacteroidota bacterium]
MLFNSFNFLIFFPVVTLLYFVLPHRLRWFMLLTASCVFYMFFIPEYILILAFTILVDYFAGILIEQENNKKKKKRWLILSLVANIGVLAIFKYYNFFNTNFKSISEAIGWNYGIPALEMVLPIGLSFHTFQAMSYTIEVYRGNQKAEKHFGIYSLYVMYYPQLVAGPIERPQNLLWQFHKKHDFDFQRVADGLKQMLFGLFKKVVIADRLATFVNPVFDDPTGAAPTSVFLATIFFSIQIFCDFSGYSDIAIGCSRVMGIDLMTNFRRPYFSTTISEFWRRWHISLSTWFKDYLYIPLGGNRNGKLKTVRNLAITFIISGLWHGANWTFIAWGALHAFYLVFAMFTEQIRYKMRNAIGLEKRKKLNHILQSSCVFLLAAFAWIFFRSETLSDASLLVKKFIVAVPLFIYNFISNEHFLWLEDILFGRTLSVMWFEVLVILLSLFIMFMIHRKQEAESFSFFIRSKPPIIRWSIYVTGVLLILFLGIYHNDNEFIYFQF